LKSSNTLCEALQDRGLSLEKRKEVKMKKGAAILGIAALLLITVAITPVLAQQITIGETTRVANVPVVNVTNTTKVVTVPLVSVNKTGNATTKSAATPGFEAVFAIAGLLAVAYLVMRQRR